MARLQRPPQSRSPDRREDRMPARFRGGAAARGGRKSRRDPPARLQVSRKGSGRSGGKEFRKGSFRSCFRPTVNSGRKDPLVSGPFRPEKGGPFPERHALLRGMAGKIPPPWAREIGCIEPVPGRLGFSGRASLPTGKSRKTFFWGPDKKGFQPEFTPGAPPTFSGAPAAIPALFRPGQERNRNRPESTGTRRKGPGGPARPWAGRGERKGSGGRDRIRPGARGPRKRRGAGGRNPGPRGERSAARARKEGPGTGTWGCPRDRSGRDHRGGTVGSGPEDEVSAFMAEPPQTPCRGPE